MLLGQAVSACSSRPAPAPPRPPVAVAVFPARWANAEGSFEVDPRRGVARGLGRGARAIDAGPELASEGSDCADDVACASRVSARLGARKALLVKLAGLGGTVLLRVVVIDVARRNQEQTRQEIVRDASPTHVDAALARLASEIARPWSPAPRPEGEGSAAPWILAGLGAAVTAGAAIVLGVALSSEDPPSSPAEERPDVVITPP
jgi:hypothetical protein